MDILHSGLQRMGFPQPYLSQQGPHLKLFQIQIIIFKPFLIPFLPHLQGDQWQAGHKGSEGSTVSLTLATSSSSSTSPESKSTVGVCMQREGGGKQGGWLHHTFLLLIGRQVKLKLCKVILSLSCNCAPQECTSHNDPQKK